MPLTPEQTRAVRHTGENLQLIACAGSGKTEVVAQHVANLLAPESDGGGGLRPLNILAFTFTEKAASELKERISNRCREHLPGLLGMAEMFVGTMHGFCLDMLAGEVPDFTKYEVLNKIQQVLLVDRNSKRCGLSSTTALNGATLRRFVDTPNYISCLSILRESEIDRSKLHDTSIWSGLSAYQDLLHEKGYLDYTSIIEEAVKALETDAALRSRISSRLKVLIVDEYQDVNPLQERLIRALHELGAKVKIVGDDDQTIYQWRGSDARNILDFTTRYPNVDTITLESNFRSSEAVIDVARLVIERNSTRLAKTMQPASRQTYEIGDVTALQFTDPFDEAAYIADTCAALRGTFIEEEGGPRAISWSDMAILLRVSRTGGPIREALQQRGIPFVSVGMNSLFDAAEAEAARQLFYMMARQADPSDVVDAWMAADLGVSPAHVRAAVDGAAEACERMVIEDQEVRFSVYNIQRQYMQFLEGIGLREENVPGGRGEAVFYNLAKFSQAISDFESINFHSSPVRKYESFADFLRHQAEGAYEQAAPADERFISPDVVQILTVHTAKGLQWPVVFVPQLVRNRFPPKAPGGRTPWHIIPNGAVLNQSRFTGSLEDERRLFYVAVTRSQKHLHLTTAPTPGVALYQRPSEFWFNVLESKYVKRRAQDLSARARGIPKPKAAVSHVKLSFSDMKYFFECPYQFKLRTLYGFNAPLDEALGYGKSLHDALAELHSRAISGQNISIGDAEELVNRHLRVPFAYPTLRETMRESAKKVIRGYIEARSAEFDKIEMSEKVVELTFEGGVSVAGRIDLVRRRDTDEIAIVDLKSSQRAQAEDLTDAQLHIYALGYRDLVGRDADFVETYELDSQTRRPRAVDAELIEEVKARVSDTAAALRTNSFPPRPLPEKCARCDFGRMCSSAC